MVRSRARGHASTWLLAFALTACGQLDNIPFGSDLRPDAGAQTDQGGCTIDDAGFPTEQLSGMLASVCQSAPLAPSCPLQVCAVYVEAGCAELCIAYIRRLLELRYGPLDGAVPPPRN